MIDPGHTAALARRGYPVVFLTAAHTFAPWRGYDKLSIPQEFRRGRYVIGKVYGYDEFGAADTSVSFDLALSAIHPTLDVALLTIAEPAATPNSTSASGRVGKPAVGGHRTGEAFLAMARSRGLARPLPLARARVGVRASLNGFRGRGALGEPNLFSDPEAMQRLPAEERARLERLSANAVGAQDACGTTLTVEGVVADAEFGAVLGAAAAAASTTSQIFSGMSGAPLVVYSATQNEDEVAPLVPSDRPGSSDQAEATAAAGRVVGLLSHCTVKKDDGGESVRFVPATEIDTWLRTLFLSESLDLDAATAAKSRVGGVSEEEAAAARSLLQDAAAQRVPPMK